MGRLLLSVVLLFPGIAISNDFIFGVYSTFTESEWEAKLELINEHQCVLNIWWENYENVDENGNPIHEVESMLQRCSWSKSQNKLIIKYHSGEIAHYRFSPELPYSQFGGNGSSPGIKPLVNDTPFTYTQWLWKFDEKP